MDIDKLLGRHWRRLPKQSGDLGMMEESENRVHSKQAESMVRFSHAEAKMEINESTMDKKTGELLFYLQFKVC